MRQNSHSSHPSPASAPGEIRMLALDVDGTLASKGDVVSANTVQALQEASRHGIAITLATGRRFRTARVVAKQLRCATDIVCLGGALVKDRKENTVHAAPIPQNTTAAVIELARAHRLAVILQHDAELSGAQDFVLDGSVPWNPHIQRYYDDHRDHAHLADALQNAASMQILVISLFATRDALEPFATRLGASHPDLNYVLVRDVEGSGCYCEITLRDIDKWSGLQHIAQRHAISPQQICTVGDELNDLPMLRASGLAVAMGNGHPQVRKLAHGVTGHHDANGIEELVNYLLR